MAAPKGNKFASHDKPWTDALRRVLAQYEDGDVKRGNALRKIAEVTIQQALAGDKDARKEIAERLDGKPLQPIAGTGEHGEILLQAIERIIVDPLQAPSDPPRIERVIN